MTTDELRIGLDIDDVLFPWSDHAHRAATRAGITNGRTITQWSMHLDYGCTPDTFWDVINQAYLGGMLLRDPYPGVTDLLQAARAAGHTIHLVTARGFEGHLAPMIRRHTIEWAQQIPHDTLTFAKDKTVVDTDVFLDDNADTVAALRHYGTDAYLRDQLHNQAADPTLPRVTDLQHFLDLAVSGGTR